MNNKHIYFAVCRYIPDLLREESINIGILTHIPEDSQVKFFKTKNLARIRHFDDEVEMEVLKALLESIDYQFNKEKHLDIDGLDDKDFLKKELVFYINQIQFSEIRVLRSNSENIEKDMMDLKDMYLYYDKKKLQRIDANRVKSLASKMVSQSYFKNLIDRHPDYENDLNQQPIDFTLKMGNDTVLYKTVSFDYKNKNRFYKEIKSLIYDLNFFKEKESKVIKVIINNTEIKEEYEKKAYEILSQIAEVYTLEQFDKHILEVGNKFDRQLSLFN